MESVLEQENILIKMETPIRVYLSIRPKNLMVFIKL